MFSFNDFGAIYQQETGECEKYKSRKEKEIKRSEIERMRMP